MVSEETIVGVDLGGTSVRAGRVRNGAIENHVSRPISGQEGVEVVLSEIFESIDEMMCNEVAGIGVGVPSVVDIDRGIVYTVKNIPSWQEVPLKDELERRYQIPAYINNDANAFAVGELYFGKGRGYRHLAGLTIGTGLGAGIVINGRLYSGANCGAGEIGNVPYRDGTLECYCSGAYLKRTSGIDGNLLYDRAMAGDQDAREIIASLGTTLGDALLVLLYLYDPEVIVLGGSVSRALEIFEGRMHERLHSFAFPHALERTVITRSENDQIAVLGAAAIYLDAELTKSI